MNTMKDTWDERKKTVVKGALVVTAVVIAYKAGKLIGENEALTTVVSIVGKDNLMRLIHTAH